MNLRSSKSQVCITQGKSNILCISSCGMFPTYVGRGSRGQAKALSFLMICWFISLIQIFEYGGSRRIKSLDEYY